VHVDSKIAPQLETFVTAYFAYRDARDRFLANPWGTRQETLLERLEYELRLSSMELGAAMIETGDYDRLRPEPPTGA